MPKINEPVSNKINEIELKNSSNTFFLQNIEFLLEFFVKIQEIKLLSWIFMDFLTQAFYLVNFHTSSKISGQTNKMPRNESKNKFIMVNKNTNPM